MGALLTAIVVAAVPSASSAKTPVSGTRTFKPPAWMLPDSPYRPRQRDEPRIQRARRSLAINHPGSYRARALPSARSAATPLAHASSANLYVGPGFPGLVDNGYYPADAQVAAGPSDIVEMTNTLVGVYSRSGFTLSEFPMTKILGSGNNDDLTDPQIAWDQTTGRWIAAAMDLSLDATEVAVSNTSDPLGGWVNYSFPFGSSLCPDQPRLGFSSTEVVVATELFYGSCHSSNEQGEQGAVMLVIDKQALLAEATNPAAEQYGPSADYTNYVPVQMLTASPVEYLASTDEGASRFVHVFELQNAPPNDTLTERDSLLIQTLQDPTLAAEHGGGVLDAGDDRINDATWQNGTLYLAADDRCSYANDRYLETCARVMEISTATGNPKVIGENDIGFPNGDAYYAAIRPDAQGNAIVVFDYSDLHDYPSIAATAAIGPIVGEQGGDFTDAVELAGGTSPTVRRWGDYSGAAVDPTNPSIIWTVGQVGDDLGSRHPYRWATHIDSVSTSAAVPDLPGHEVDPGFLYRGKTSQRQRITIRPSGGGGHIENATITLSLPCRGHRSDPVTFKLTYESRQRIGANGRFRLREKFGADPYATAYSAALAGTFRAPGHVTGTASGNEHSRTLGVCRGHHVRYSIHD